MHVLLECMLLRRAAAMGKGEVLVVWGHGTELVDHSAESNSAVGALRSSGEVGEPSALGCVSMASSVAGAPGARVWSKTRFDAASARRAATAPHAIDATSLRNKLYYTSEPPRRPRPHGAATC